MIADPSLRPPTPHTGTAAILARRARDAGNRSETAALLERALAIAADHAEVLQDHTLLALEAGRPQIALAAATRGSQISAASAAARSALGIASRQCGLTDAERFAGEFEAALLGLWHARPASGAPGAVA